MTLHNAAAFVQLPQSASERPPTRPPLVIGNISLDFPGVQAALSGYSDWAMRKIARQFGACYTLCEVVLDQLVLQAGKRTLKHIHTTCDEFPVGGQLMGARPEDFAPAAVRLVDAGFNVVDINFGCPVKKVLGRCRGGFLLGQPQTALEIVSRVREAVPDRIPVTVKMRRGLDDTAQSRDQFFSILDGAFARGVAAITVHGRTVKQRYIGPSSWPFLKEVKAHVGNQTILGSGDLFTAESCVRMLQETGVNGLSIARGAIGNPWIFKELEALLAGRPLPKPPGTREQGETILAHFRLAEELYGEDAAGRQMRKFGIKYAQLHPDYLLVRDAFIGTKTTADWHAVIERWYQEDRPGVRPSLELSAGESAELMDCG